VDPQTEFFGDGTDFRFSEFADGQKRVRKLLLRLAKQHIRLVFCRVHRLAHVPAALHFVVAFAGIVPGRDIFGAELAGLVEKDANLMWRLHSMQGFGVRPLRYSSTK